MIMFVKKTMKNDEKNNFFRDLRKN
jgi:hypothetical protein